MNARDETWLVTGALGCIGSWTLRELVRQDASVVAFDRASEAIRPRLLLTDQELARVTFVQGDITDTDLVTATVARHGITHIVHLAALQVPFCRANPPQGAAVNVVGTVNIFEAARQAGGQVQGLAYASSVAALGPPDIYSQAPVADDARPQPRTLYGVYKVANEGTARLYWQNWQVGSVGLRPFIVYGVGRDQGLTSDIAKALLATAASRPFHIRFSGQVALQYAGDIARAFIDAARSAYRGAAACNLRNDVVSVAEFVDVLCALAPEAEVTVEPDSPLPFPADLDDGRLQHILGTVPHTPLPDAINATLTRFRLLLTKDRIDLSQLDG
jgi:nucleoside-diphosphate-sugar epimerase